MFRIITVVIIVLSEVCIYAELNELYIYNDFATVRNKPVVDSKVIDKLPIGYKVNFIKSEGLLYNVQGLKYNWYLVSYKTNNLDKQGYLWGGFLTYNYTSISNNKILLGLDSYSSSTGFIASIKFIEGERVISKLPFIIKTNSYEYSDPACVPVFELRLYDGLGINNIDNIIKVNVSYSCNDHNNKLWLHCYTKKYIFAICSAKLFLMGSYNNPEHNDGYDETDELIFPNEPDGENGVLIHKIIKYDFSEKLNKKVLIKSIRDRYRWNGSAIELI